MDIHGYMPIIRKNIRQALFALVLCADASLSVKYACVCMYYMDIHGYMNAATRRITRPCLRSSSADACW